MSQKPRNERTLFSLLSSIRRTVSDQQPATPRPRALRLSVPLGGSCGISEDQGNIEWTSCITPRPVSKRPSDLKKSNAKRLVDIENIRKSSVGPRATMLKETLRDIKMRTVLMDFSIKEYSSENLFIWDRIQSYKEAEDVQVRKSIAETINSTFLVLSAEVPVNLSHELKKETGCKIRLEQFEDDLFADIESEIEYCLLDIFNRFCVSEDYFAKQLDLAALPTVSTKSGWINKLKRLASFGPNRAVLPE